MRRVLLAFGALTGSTRYRGFPAAPLKPLARVLAALAPTHSDLKMVPGMLERFVTPIAFSMEKAQRLLGWQPRVDVEEGAQKSLPWIKEVRLL
jgi:nucleoside-diphosphate-sugar epimerase